MSRLFTTGTTDKVTVTPAASINNLAKRTIMVWLKLVGYGSFQDTTWYSRGNATFADVSDGVTYAPGLAHYGGLNYVTADAQFQDDVGADAPQLGTWVHVALTLDTATDNKWHLFINAVEIGSYTTQSAGTGGLSDDSAVNLLVGSFGNLSLTLDGRLYDFRLYDSILTPTELAEIVAGGHTVDPQPTHNKCQLTFATDQGSPEPDASGSSNTGAITGATFSSDNPSFVPPPTVTQISPVVGNQGVNHKPVTVSGSDFDPATAVLSFSGAGVTVDGYASRSATQIQAFISIDPAAGATARDVIVTNGDTQSDTLSAAFTVVTFTPGGDSGPTYRTERIPRVPRRGMV